MKKYVLLLLAIVASVSTATAANVELRGEDLAEDAKGVVISEDAARLSGLWNDQLDEGIGNVIPVALRHAEEVWLAPFFMQAIEL